MDPRLSWGGLLCRPKVAALSREQGLQTHLHDGFSFCEFVAITEKPEISIDIWIPGDLTVDPLARVATVPAAPRCPGPPYHAHSLA